MSNEVYRKIENQNFIIFGGITVASAAVLYFYKFHFATIAISYVFGCVACYSGLKSTTLRNYLDKLKRSFLSCDNATKEKPTSAKDCMACGSRDCDRHNATLDSEPWVGLRVHKQLDQAIEDFYNSILEQFINTWYNKITPQPFFVDELRHQLRYASACLLRRAIKINYPRLITERLVPCALRHYETHAAPDKMAANPGGGALGKMAVHPAAANRRAELQYLRSIANALMPFLIESDSLNNSVFRVLVREIFSGWVLLPLTDALADPYILNTLIVLATGDETMAQLPETPDYEVEFLETFVRQMDSVYAQRGKLLRVDLDLVLGDQNYFYAFMQHTKTTGHFNLLQFCKGIQSFQTRILNPDLSELEQASLFDEGRRLWAVHMDPASAAAVRLEPELVRDVRDLLALAPDVRRLQTGRALYRAAGHALLLLERGALHRFLHSQEYYNLVIGPRVPMGYHKQMTKKPHEKVKLGTKLRHASRAQTLDGHLLDYTGSNSDINMDNINLMDNFHLLKYLAQEDALREQDLSTCKVVLTQVEVRPQRPPRRGTVRVFTAAVHRLDPVRADASLWTVRRTEHDFHLLRSKLQEFHGDTLLQSLPLPSRRDNSPMETIRYKYEDFLQRLLQMSLLQTSELLRIFLMEEGDFSVAVQAASLNAANSDLTNIYQTVTHRLRKEKGQHLESFMNVLLISSDKDRWDQARRDVEFAQEVDEEYQSSESSISRRPPRDIYCSVFGNNFGVEPEVGVYIPPQDTVVGFTQCFIYLLIKVVKAHGILINIVGGVLGMMREFVDQIFNKLLDRKLRSVLTQRRLAHLIRIGHSMIQSSRPRGDLRALEATAQGRLSVRAGTALLAGAGLPAALRAVHSALQDPALNKQLVYSLLDHCLLELFPELAAIETKDKNQRVDS